MSESGVDRGVVYPTRESITALSSGMLILFLLSYLTQFSLSRLAFHSIVLIPALLLSFWMVFTRLCEKINVNTTISKVEYGMMGVVFLFLVSAFGVHRTQTLLIDARPYLIGFLAYFSVRMLAMRALHCALIRMFAFYLIAAGLLTLLQVTGGEQFYIATYFGAKIQTKYGLGFSAFPNYGAVLMLWPLTLLMFDLVSGRVVGKLDGYIRWAGLVLGTVGVFFTLSRAAGAGMAVAVIILLVRTWPSAAWVCTIKVLTVVALTLFISYMVPSKTDRFIGVKIKGELSPYEWTQAVEANLGLFSPSSSSYSTNTRLFALYVAKETLIGNPVWGVGLGRYPAIYASFFKDMPLNVQERLDQRPEMTPHNSYVQYAVEVGIFPLIGLLFFAGMILCKGLPLDMSSPGLAYAAGLAAVMIWMLFHDLFGDRLFWIALGLCVAFLRPLSGKVSVWRMAD